MYYEEKMAVIKQALDYWYDGEYTEEKGSLGIQELKKVFDLDTIGDIYSLLNDGEFTKGQAEKILDGFARGLTKEQVSTYAHPSLMLDDMSKIMASLELGKSEEDCRSFANAQVNRNQNNLIDYAIDLMYASESSEENLEEAFELLDELYNVDAQQEIMWAYYENGFTRRQMEELLEPGLDAEMMETRRKDIRGPVQDVVYQKEFAEPIKEVFEADAVVMEKLYEGLDAVSMNDEAKEFFASLLDMMQELKTSEERAENRCKALEKQLVEIQNRPGIKENVVAHVQTAGDIARKEYEQMTTDFRDTKNMVVSKVKTAISEYADQGKIALMRGVSGITNGLMKMNAFLIKRVNGLIDENRAQMLKYAEIEKEMGKTGKQVKDLFKVLSGKEADAVMKEESAIINFLRKNLEYSTENDVRTVNVLMAMNESIGNFRDSFEEKTEKALRSEKGKEMFNEVKKEALAGRLENANRVLELSGPVEKGTSMGQKEFSH